jgi:transcriptional repressor NrdR
MLHLGQFMRENTPRVTAMLDNCSVLYRPLEFSYILRQSGGIFLERPATMKCPFCRSDNDKVIDSRASQDGFVIRRRRECLGCHRRYTTYERVEEWPLKVVKKDGTRVPYERERIQRGIEKACWKRSIRDDQIEAILVEIENDIYANFESEVESRYLGELIMEHLRRLDQVAYVRFASVYREFQDVHDFVDELQPMLKDTRPK